MPPEHEGTASPAVPPLPAPYRGRFAPTPSGPLHFGSIVAAVGSYVDALAHDGEWHLRIDDVDPPRVAPDAESRILATLEALGFEWTGPVTRQSNRIQAYTAALERLRERAHIYPCTCTRVEIAQAGLPGIEGPRYPGTCRAGLSHPFRAPAWRLEVDDTPVTFVDLLQGGQSQNLAAATGDFVLRRADGVFAYHLACVVDDAQAGFTHVVRGADLLDSVGRQAHLARLLGCLPMTYLHLPVAVDRTGQKLSKQSLAPAVDPAQPGSVIAAALSFLGHPPPGALEEAPVRELWSWSRAAWSRDRLPRARTLLWESPAASRAPK